MQVDILDNWINVGSVCDLTVFLFRLIFLFFCSLINPIGEEVLLKDESGVSGGFLLDVQCGSTHHPKVMITS